MLVKGIIEEDFTNYREPAMFINTCFCDFKCCNEAGLSREVCQNAPLAKAGERHIPDKVIYEHYIQNPITKAIVFGGMEPFLQIEEILKLLKLFRDNGDESPFVIYTGYTMDEVEIDIKDLRKYKNVIVKFGRFRPDSKSVYDEVLGVTLVSDNQYAVWIS